MKLRLTYCIVASALITGSVGCKSISNMFQSKPPQPVVKETRPRISSDSLFITMERTACLGTCPVYKVDIYQKGYVVYHGYNFVDKKGIYSTVLQADKVKKLVDYVKDIKFFDFKDSYINPYISDFQTTIVSVNSDGKSKTINDGHDETPTELVYLEKLVDDSMDSTLVWKVIKEEYKPDPVVEPVNPKEIKNNPFYKN